MLIRKLFALSLVALFTFGAVAGCKGPEAKSPSKPAEGSASGGADKATTTTQGAKK